MSFKTLKWFSRSWPRLLFSAMSLILISLSGRAFGQNDPDIDLELPLRRDSILSVRNLSSANDTIKLKQMIAIKYQSLLVVDSLQVLYIDGVPVPESHPWRINEEENIIYFTIDQSVQNLLLKFAEGENDDNPFIPVYFGLGSKYKQAILSKTSIYVEVHQKIWVGWFVATGLAIFTLIVLALRSNVLKDENNLYFSLGRTQLFFWTLLFMVAYIFICFKTDSLPDIPTSVLIIIGISVTTTGASSLIDSKAKNATPIDPEAKSEGFFADILSDGSSINIQRFQNVAFNVIFGILFLQKALSDHLLPDFDQNVLILLGLSSGAYAGLKTTEKAKDQTEPPAITVGDQMDSNAAQAPTAVRQENITNSATSTSTDAADNDANAS